MDIELKDNKIPSTNDGFSAIEPPNVQQPNEKKPIRMPEPYLSKPISCAYSVGYCSMSCCCPCVSLISCIAGIGCCSSRLIAICCHSQELLERLEAYPIQTLCRCCGMYNGVIFTEHMASESLKHFRRVISPLEPGVITEMKRTV